MHSGYKSRYLLEIIGVQDMNLGGAGVGMSRYVFKDKMSCQALIRIRQMKRPSIT